MSPAPWPWAGNVENDAGRALPRLWATLMSARVLVALAMLGLHLVVHPSDRPIPPWVLGLCVAYLALTVLARMVATAQAPGQPWEVHWRYAVGVDIVFFVGLQWARATDVNYTPLLVLPVLLAAIMGSRVLALGTAALITLLLPTDLQAWLDAQERQVLMRALQLTGFNRTVAAARLGLNLRQMRYRIARLGIAIPTAGAPDDDGAAD